MPSRSAPQAVRVLVLVLGCFAVGCTVGFPSVPGVDAGGDIGGFGPVYVDFVLSVGPASNPQNCLGAGGVPVCTQPEMPQQGPCAGNPALGPPDGNAYTLPALGRIELGYLCSAIVALPLDPNNQQQPDFEIIGTVNPGAHPAVEVSFDGSNYEAVNPWPQDKNLNYLSPGTFQLAAANLEEARFVRISEASGGGTISIDAVEALAGLQ